mmetsp:Transcript_37041/g.78028  ORF Transcript_37041/g.78028 Transcript_37041/m.78028 type:complete len:329 (-) Transcript_37041:632-1618(-)
MITAYCYAAIATTWPVLRTVGEQSVMSACATKLMAPRMLKPHFVERTARPLATATSTLQSARERRLLKGVLLEASERQESAAGALREQLERGTDVSDIAESANACGLPEEELEKSKKAAEKQRRRAELVPVRLAEVESMQKQIEDLLVALSDADADMAEVRARMCDIGLGKRLETFDVDSVRQYGRPDGFRGLVLTSPRGVPILVGKKGIESDALLRQTARGADLWFQVREGPGSRVLLRVSMHKSFGKGNRSCMEMAANLAAYFSQARTHDEPVEVMYTDSRRVAARGSKIGQMKYSKRLGSLEGNPAAVADAVKEAQLEQAGWGYS